MVECFDPLTNECCLSESCGLKGVLGQAVKAYLAVLDAVTLADLIAPASPLAGSGLLPIVALPNNGKARGASWT